MYLPPLGPEIIVGRQDPAPEVADLKKPVTASGPGQDRLHQVEQYLLVQVISRALTLDRHRLIAFLNTFMKLRCPGAAAGTIADRSGWLAAWLATAPARQLARMSGLGCGELARDAARGDARAQAEVKTFRLIAWKHLQSIDIKIHSYLTSFLNSAGIACQTACPGRPPGARAIWNRKEERSAVRLSGIFLIQDGAPLLASS
jgi:hypothetical protein